MIPQTHEKRKMTWRGRLLTLFAVVMLVGLTTLAGARVNAAGAASSCEPACGPGETCVCSCAPAGAVCDPQNPPANCDCRCGCKDN